GGAKRRPLHTRLQRHSARQQSELRCRVVVRGTCAALRKCKEDSSTEGGTIEFDRSVPLLSPLFRDFTDWRPGERYSSRGCRTHEILSRQMRPQSRRDGMIMRDKS